MEELIERLQRYSKQCLAERLDYDFAEAVVDAITILQMVHAAEKLGNRTNGDRIRSMTDEELAELLVSTDGDFPPNCESVPIRKLDAYWLDWLKKDADNG